MLHRRTARLDARFTPSAYAMSLVSLAVAALSACGGGGGSSSSSQNYKISGTVSGLVRPIVLQNNGGDSLAVSTNGIFNFATRIPQGFAYSVTVQTQAAAQTCTVTSGTGTATADVVNVSIACVPSTTAFWAPLRAESTSFGSGTTGLYVLPADAIDVVPTQIVNGLSQPLDYVIPHEINVNGAATAGHPLQFIYAATPPGGGAARLWALDLTTASTLSPRQLSNLPLPFLQPNFACSRASIYRDLNDPSTLFFLLQLLSNATTGTCSSEWTVVHASDSASTTPTTVAIQPDNVEPLYRPDGTLAGLVMINANHELRYYTDETFSNSVQLLANISTFIRAAVDSPSPFSHLPRWPTTMLFWATSSAGSQLYRLSYTGQLSLIHTSADSIEPQWSDDQVYIFTHAHGGDPVTIDYYRVATQSGTTVQLLWSVTQPQSEPRLNVAGASGSTLVLTQAFYSPNLNTNHLKLWTLPADQSGTPVQIADINSNVYGAFVSSDNIYVTRMVASSGFPTTWAYSTTVLGLDGSVKVPLRDNSMFTGSNPLLLLDAGTYYQASVTGNMLNQTLIQRPDGAPATFNMNPFEGTNVSSYEPAFSMGDSGNATGGWRALAFDAAHSRIAAIDFPYSFTYFVTFPRF